MTNFHLEAIDRFSKMVTRHSHFREAIRKAITQGKAGDTLRLVATLESALAEDEEANKKDSP